MDSFTAASDNLDPDSSGAADCRTDAQETPPPAAAESAAGAARFQGEIKALEAECRQGKWAEATARCRALLGAADATPMVYGACGAALSAAGQHLAALHAFRGALALGRETARLHDAAGLCCLALRDTEGALSHFQAGLALQGDAPAILLHQGKALLEWGRAEEAETFLRRAVQTAPELAQAHFLLGRAAEARQRPSEALAHYGNAARRDPRDAAALMRAGDILGTMGRFEEALAAFRQVLAIRPEDAAARVRAGQILSSKGMLQEAERLLHAALAQQPGNAEALVSLGQIQASCGEAEAAARSYAGALRARPNYLAARLAQIGLCEREGKDSEARDRASALLTQMPGHPQLLTLWGRLARTPAEREDALARLEERLREDRPPLSKDFESALRFTAGTLYDKTGRPAEAFRHFQAANAYRNKARRYNAARTIEEFNRLREYLSADVLAKLPSSRLNDARPVFIVGMPRSGTSLVEQILASHPQVYGAGELRQLEEILRRGPEGVTAAYPKYLPDLTEDALDALAAAYLRALPPAAAAAQRVTDKMPHNFQHAGIISRLFPQARIIHCVRDARDTCLSCFFQSFAEGNSYSYGLADCGHYYRQYQTLMTHWRESGVPLFDVRYETLVTEPEATVRNLLEYCGLEWDDACLRFHENRRVVHTASYKQVKEPFHTRSIGRWRAYAPFLEPLLTALGESADEAVNCA